MKKMQKKRLVFVLLFFFSGLIAYASEIKLVSPANNIAVEVILKEKIYYSVFFRNERVLNASPLSLSLENTTLGKDPKMLDFSENAVDTTIRPVWGSRHEVNDNYNQLTINFAGNYSVEFRAYDNGIAYRFVTRLKEKQVIVKNEQVEFRFNADASAWVLDEPNYETNYMFVSLNADSIQRRGIGRRMHKICLPVIVQATPNVKVAITEADLFDYPSLFLDRGNDVENNFSGSFEKYVLTAKRGGYNNYLRNPDKEADYIAKTNGSREYPWRLLVISDDDRTFADCDLVYQLSRPCKLPKTDWIKPGKVAWEWWHDYAVEGQDLKGGVNTQTYLYHIDFAANYGLEYILIDAGLTDKDDLTLLNPEVDLKKIVDYGSSKGVKVIVWVPGHSLYEQLNKALDLFASYGVAGIKADFFYREDQTGIQIYENIARAAAERKMLVDFHGCTKPTGLSRAYPNVINWEAVAGNEWNKINVDKATVAHKVLLPFARGLQGPMDYTPGGMRNLQSGHNQRMTLPCVHGTRCNEISLYVLYNEPLQMLCDAPSVYEHEPEITKFIAKIPTTWDETKVLEAKFGEYLVEARKTGNTWYVAGMTGKQPQQATIDFSFLGDGNYTAQILKDGPNSDRIGTDYLFENVPVNKDSNFAVKMAHGGGFVMRITR